MTMTRKKFLPPERFNKSSKKYRSPFGPPGQIDGRTFKRDRQSGALVFNPLPEDVTAPELVHYEREDRKREVGHLRQELDSARAEMHRTRDEMKALKKTVNTLVKPKPPKKGLPRKRKK